MAALGGFGDPVMYGEYIAPAGTPKPSRYYTFNYSKSGVNFGDDAPGHERYLIQVHLFCPGGFDSVQRTVQTQQRLFTAGLTWPDVTNASDADGQHIVFECETVEGASLIG